MTTVQGWTFDISTEGFQINDTNAYESTVTYDESEVGHRRGTLTVTLVPNHDQLEQIYQYTNWISNSTSGIFWPQSSIVMHAGGGSSVTYENAILTCYSHMFLNGVSTCKMTWVFQNTTVVAIPPRELRSQRPPLQKLDWRVYGF